MRVLVLLTVVVWVPACLDGGGAGREQPPLRTDWDPSNCTQIATLSPTLAPDGSWLQDVNGNFVIEETHVTDVFGYASTTDYVLDQLAGTFGMLYESWIETDPDTGEQSAVVVFYSTALTLPSSEYGTSHYAEDGTYLARAEGEPRFTYLENLAMKIAGLRFSARAIDGERTHIYFDYLLEERITDPMGEPVGVLYYTNRGSTFATNEEGSTRSIPLGQLPPHPSVYVDPATRLPQPTGGLMPVTLSRAELLAIIDDAQRRYEIEDKNGDHHFDVGEALTLKIGPFKQVLALQRFPWAADAFGMDVLYIEAADLVENGPGYLEGGQPFINVNAVATVLVDLRPYELSDLPQVIVGRGLAYTNHPAPVKDTREVPLGSGPLTRVGVVRGGTDYFFVDIPAPNMAGSLVRYADGYIFPATFLIPSELSDEQRALIAARNLETGRVVRRREWELVGEKPPWVPCWMWRYAPPPPPTEPLDGGVKLKVAPPPGAPIDACNPTGDPAIVDCSCREDDGSYWANSVYRLRDRGDVPDAVPVILIEAWQASTANHSQNCADF